MFSLRSVCVCERPLKPFPFRLADANTTVGAAAGVQGQEVNSFYCL